MADLVLGVALATGYALAGDPSHALPDTTAAFDRDRMRTALTALEQAGVHFLLFDDDLGPLREGDRWIPRPDPTVFCSFIAQLCTRLGLVITTQTAQLEPFHVAKHLQTVDNASHGRAGWSVRVGQSAMAVAHIGRGTKMSAEDELAEAGEFADVVTKLWDSWEAGAVIRDVERGLYLDLDRVHHINFRGRFLSVRGPSLHPRSPQGRPPIFTRVVDAGTAGFAKDWADVAIAADEATAPGTPRTLLEVPLTGQETAADLREQVSTACADGLVLVCPAGAALPLSAISELAAGLPLRRLPPRASLREALGLDVADNQYTRARRA
ncbi:LLM class flavin-dependent oxidoreductase [Pseudonocardia yunnanensis]|uniref:LLM class flavin-dependent oxidoreductase n=1 Tax=Pseudonocardia yunnanensis TaxID=58107 RepID=A0ABW4F4L8_9PSEU